MTLPRITATVSAATPESISVLVYEHAADPVPATSTHVARYINAYGELLAQLR